jgi:hypothetical protein
VAPVEPNTARLPAGLVRDLRSSWDSTVSCAAWRIAWSGGRATALVWRCDAAGGSYGGHSWPSAHVQARIGPAAPGRPIRPLVAEDQSAEGVRNWAGPGNHRWSALGPCRNGPLRAWAVPPVMHGLEEPQVAGSPAQAPGIMRVGDSDCGPEGRHSSYRGRVSSCGRGASRRRHPTALPCRSSSRTCAISVS